jgi:hypothetical protein
MVSGSADVRIREIAVRDEGRHSSLLFLVTIEAQSRRRHESFRIRTTMADSRAVRVGGSMIAVCRRSLATLKVLRGSTKCSRVNG